MLLVRDIRRLLAHLHDYGYLQKDRLAADVLRPWLRSSAPPTGVELHEALLHALEELRPLPSIAETDKAWRPYHILRLTYVERLTPNQVLERIGISRALYFREQNRALHQLMSLFEQRSRETQTAAAESEAIPRLEHFIGREATLAYFRQRLQTDHMAIICGMAGVGKTALAAELASERQKGGPVLWMSFRRGRNTSLEAALEALGLAMAAQGRSDFWRFHQSKQRTDKPPSQTVQIRYLISLLEQAGYTVCLDDAHWAASDPGLQDLLMALRQSAALGKLWLIVTARETPAFASGLSYAPLAGLSLADTQQLLARAGLGWIWDPLVDRLHQRTEGHPALLNLFIAWVRNQGLTAAAGAEGAARVRRFIETMEQAPDVRHYLLRDVYDSLSPVEQHFVHFVSAVRIPFDENAPGLAAILADEGLSDVVAILDSLVDKHLATRLEGENRIAFHGLIRDYFYSRFKGRIEDQMRLHRRLGDYYAREGGDYLEAAYHFCQAQRYDRATDLLVSNVEMLHNRGQSRQALEQIESITSNQVDPRRWQALCRTRADLYLSLGEYELALAQFREVLEAGEGTWGPDERVDLLRKMGRACERRGETDQALAYLHAGHEALVAANGGGQSLVAVRLYGLLGWIYIRLKGDYETGRHYSEQALSIIDERLKSSPGVDERAQLRKEQAWIYNSLGVMAAQQSHFRQALDYFSRSLAIRESLQDTYGVAICHSNLGGLYVYIGDPVRAIEHSRRCLEIAEAMGDLEAVQRVLSNLGEGYVLHGEFDLARQCAVRCLDLAAQSSNDHNIAAANDTLGWAYYHMGDYSQAEACYCTALEIRRDHTGEIDGIALAHTRLGQLYLDWGRVDQAMDHLREALRIFGDTGSQWLLPEVYCALAGVQQARGETSLALASAQRALALAEAAGHRVYQARAYCVLGEIFGHSDPVRAAEYFERSIALLIQSDHPLELARTRRNFAEFLRMQNAHEPAFFP